jgi:hypothetical protein
MAVLPFEPGSRYQTVGPIGAQLGVGSVPSGRARTVVPVVRLGTPESLTASARLSFSGLAAAMALALAKRRNPAPRAAAAIVARPI